MLDTPPWLTVKFTDYSQECSKYLLHLNLALTLLRFTFKCTCVDYVVSLFAHLMEEKENLLSNKAKDRAAAMGFNRPVQYLS